MAKRSKSRFVLAWLIEQIPLCFKVTWCHRVSYLVLHLGVLLGKRPVLSIVFYCVLSFPRNCPLLFIYIVNSFGLSTRGPFRQLVLNDSSHRRHLPQLHLHGFSLLSQSTGWINPVLLAFPTRSLHRLNLTVPAPWGSQQLGVVAICHPIPSTDNSNWQLKATQ